MTPLTMCVMQLASPATSKMFTRILTSALIAGAAAGFAAAVLQLLFLQPVLLHAELYEAGELVHFAGASNPAAHPPIGFDPLRDSLSVVFSMLVYAGYGLILVALMSLAEEKGAIIDSRHGLLWGLAGFVTVQLAPGFSLAPEVPGVAAADVSARQIWWFATVIATGLAVWLIAFGSSWIVWGAAVILLVAPHVIGAPEPEVFTGPVPTELGALYAARVFGVGMAAWALCGLFAGGLWASSEEASQ